MLDFTGMRRRADVFQEREGLGTDGYALSQDVLALLEELKDASKERDEARELHAKLCDQYSDAIVRLNRIHVALDGWRHIHRMDPEAVAMNGKFVGTIPAMVNDA